MSERTRKVVGGAKRVASAAALRTLSSQAVKKSKAAMVLLLSRKLAPGDKGFQRRLAAFLDTQMGEGLLAGVLSVLTLPTSQFGDDGEPLNGVAKIGAELQILSLHKMSDDAIDQLTEPLMILAKSAFGKEALDIAGNVRVAAEAIESGEEMEEERVVSKKKAHAE